MKWINADRYELYQRVSALEFELRLAAAMIESREKHDEERGVGRSEIATELQQGWRELLEAEPTPAREAAA